MNLTNFRARTEEREKIKQDVEEYLAKGNSIPLVPISFEGHKPAYETKEQTKTRAKKRAERKSEKKEVKHENH